MKNKPCKNIIEKSFFKNSVFQNTQIFGVTNWSKLGHYIGTGAVE